MNDNSKEPMGESAVGTAAYQHFIREGNVQRRLTNQDLPARHTAVKEPA